MNKNSVKIEIARERSGYEIVIGNNLIAASGKWARKCLGITAKKIVLVSNPTVFRLYGVEVVASLRKAGFAVSHWLMKDGEQHKNINSLGKLLAFMAESGLSRTDAVIALGGGVVGDLAGFAAATYLRGVPFLQIPTTLLAMIDSSVGGKTGVNSSFGKNTIGAFHQPNGVLIDVSVLNALPPRELTAGLCEMVKHGAIGGNPLLNRTGKLLDSRRGQKIEISDFTSQIVDLIALNVQFKAMIVAGDELESSMRTDTKSRKILNFGHTLAHALEKVTNYKYFKHGEAVGYGILYAAELSKTLALCDENDVNLLNDVVRRVGNLPSLAGIDSQEVFEAFRFDKKNLSGSLQMVLLRGIGKPVIVKDDAIPHSTARRTLKELMQKLG